MVVLTSHYIGLHTHKVDEINTEFHPIMQQATGNRGSRKEKEEGTSTAGN